MPPWARPCGAFEEKAPLWLSADKDKADKGDVEKKVDDKAAAVGKWRPSRSSSSSAAYGSSSYGSSASPYSRKKFSCVSFAWRICAPVESG